MPRYVMEGTVILSRPIAPARKFKLNAFLGSFIFTQLLSFSINGGHANPLISSGPSVSADLAHLQNKAAEQTKSLTADAENRTLAPEILAGSLSPDSPANKVATNEADISKISTSTELNEPQESYTIFLDSNQPASGGEPLELKMPSEENALDQTNLNGQNFVSKYRRQAPSTADWWTRLSHKGKSATKTSYSDTKIPAAEKSPKKSPEVELGTKKIAREAPTPADGPYKEQPLSQNAILTIRNQLNAIRGKQRILMTRSVRQLQQLDQKLIDSYKLCLKKKMPLYAGMLYRTRDYVVRMANDVKHEKKVLDAMTKQVNSVLKQRMQNYTLVKEYNKLLAKTSETKESRVNIYEVPNVPIESQNIKVVPTKIVQQRLKKEASSSKTNSEVQQELHEVQQGTELYLDKKGAETTSLPELSLSKKTDGRKSTGLRRGETQTEALDELSGVKTRLDFKAKPTKYIVHVNEVNLKKELNKIQLLIDRVNTSSTELTSVVDDIVYLFKLNTKPVMKKGYGLASKVGKFDKMYSQMQEIDESSSSTSDRKRAKHMMYKSPAKLLLEKYGKLTSGTKPSSNSTVVNNDTTNYSSISALEFKPLFDESMTSYSENADAELGFDYATAVNE